MKSKSIQNLLDWLETKGLLQNRNHAEVAILCDINRPAIPMTIKLGSVISALVVMTILIYYIFPNSVDSLIARLTSFTLLSIPIYLIYTFVLLTLYTLYVWRERSKHWEPLVIACILFISLLSIILSYKGIPSNVPLVVFNATLAGFLMALCLTFSRSKPAILACVCLALLSLMTSNGVLWSIGLLLLGYGKHQRTLIYFGFLFLILFISEFYYNLPMTLQYKSYTLIASGLTLILVYFGIKTLRWDRD
jgi:hypothetical protein